MKNFSLYSTGIDKQFCIILKSLVKVTPYYSISNSLKCILINLFRKLMGNPFLPSPCDIGF